MDELFKEYKRKSKEFRNMVTFKIHLKMDEAKN